ncbi:hypothetical protein [Pseudomonas sp. Leaf127]|uniref:hypothetical protein n=1 Tax=Pseudomonas sp. Leaf127 TaxID=1736267 RepID=UPI000ACA65D9|nr:hypothetical protein [Pseudomonas sp. Leaf127]
MGTKKENREREIKKIISEAILSGCVNGDETRSELASSIVDALKKNKYEIIKKKKESEDDSNPFFKIISI